MDLTLEQMDAIAVEKWPKLQVSDGGQQTRGVNEVIQTHPFAAVYLTKNNPVCIVYAGKELNLLQKSQVM